MTKREDWIEWKWTPEKPYPETLETRVAVLWQDGRGPGFNEAEVVSYWDWKTNNDNSDISYYKVIP